MIMYIAVNGRHPLYVAGEGKVSYSAKLKDPKWKFPNTFSPLAASLFSRMAKVNPLERYTAREALSHPWITRRPDPIPLSYYETISYEKSKCKFGNVRYIP